MSKRGKLASPTARINKIVEEATRLSELEIGEESGTATKRRRNMERLSEISEKMLRSQPIVEPTAPNVSHAGKMAFGSKFLSEPSIYNRYAKLLRIWNAAYESIVSSNADYILSQNNEQAFQDHATSAEINQYRSIINKQRREMDRLRQILTASQPLILDKSAAQPEGEGAELFDLSPIKDWVSQVEGGSLPLEVVETGIQICDRGRPRMFVMDADVHQLLKSL
jgi:hypothetical protein